MRSYPPMRADVPRALVAHTPDAVQWGPTALAMEVGAGQRDVLKSGAMRRSTNARAGEHTFARTLFLCYIALAVLDDSTIAPVALSDVVARAVSSRIHVSDPELDVGGRMRACARRRARGVRGVCTPGCKAAGVRPAGRHPVRAGGESGVDGARDPDEGPRISSSSELNMDKLRLTIISLVYKYTMELSSTADEKKRRVPEIIVRITVLSQPAGGAFRRGGAESGNIMPGD
ncbi:hypothetical protein B0H17DRAFT_1144720 [Mycena rosella]|uniref:Uncharacterized protein n=1 Tax=Mycena rosella TaxID=1033263 RepID=A0AAD7CSU3_MYCRO|nr:hypothetical protein B0H17DRAFT_1144720 [Mycena rosella]